MLVDTHAHVNFKDFKKDYKDVLKHAHKQGVVVINVGSQISTSQRAVKLAQEFDKTFAAIGLHPIQLQPMKIKEAGVIFKSRAEEFDPAAYQQLAREKQVKAIGECGLDYYHLPNGNQIEAKKKQKQVLQQQIDLANAEDLPMILHCRGSKIDYLDAYKDLFKELKNNLPKKRGVLHCFGANWELAEQFLELGFYLGFTGVITFDQTGKSIELLQKIPEDRILSETDCPYLTPEPFRGQRNEPVYVEYVVKKIAEVRQISFVQAAEITFRNAKTLFELEI